jgi:hypothetical protein
VQFINTLGLLNKKEMKAYIYDTFGTGTVKGGSRNDDDLFVFVDAVLGNSLQIGGTEEENRQRAAAQAAEPAGTGLVRRTPGGLNEGLAIQPKIDTIVNGLKGQDGNAMEKATNLVLDVHKNASKMMISYDSAMAVEQTSSSGMYSTEKLGKEITDFQEELTNDIDAILEMLADKDSSIIKGTLPNISGNRLARSRTNIRLPEDISDRAKKLKRVIKQMFDTSTLHGPISQTIRKTKNNMQGKDEGVGPIVRAAILCAVPPIAYLGGYEYLVWSPERAITQNAVAQQTYIAATDALTAAQQTLAAISGSEVATAAAQPVIAAATKSLSATATQLAAPTAAAATAVSTQLAATAIPSTSASALAVASSAAAAKAAVDAAAAAQAIAAREATRASAALAAIVERGKRGLLTAATEAAAAAAAAQPPVPGPPLTPSGLLSYAWGGVLGTATQTLDGILGVGGDVLKFGVSGVTKLITTTATSIASGVAGPTATAIVPAAINAVGSFVKNNAAEIVLVGAEVYTVAVLSRAVARRWAFQKAKAEANKKLNYAKDILRKINTSYANAIVNNYLSEMVKGLAEFRLLISQYNKSAEGRAVLVDALNLKGGIKGMLKDIESSVANNYTGANLAVLTSKALDPTQRGELGEQLKELSTNLGGEIATTIAEFNGKLKAIENQQYRSEQFGQASLRFVNWGAEAAAAAIRSTGNLAVTAGVAAAGAYFGGTPLATAAATGMRSILQLSPQGLPPLHPGPPQLQDQQATFQQQQAAFQQQIKQLQDQQAQLVQQQIDQQRQRRGGKRRTTKYRRYHKVRRTQRKR